MIIETIRGEVTGEPLISLWQHYPDVDMDPIKLAERTIAVQRKFPSDIIKLSPQGRFPVVDFGCKIQAGTDLHGGSGSASCLSCIIKSPEDWSQIEYVDPADGELGRQLQFISRVAKELPDTPKMMTIFAPTMVARKLSRNEFANHLFDSDEGKTIEEAIKTISRVVTDFGKACLEAGAEGLFIAVQEADINTRPSSKEIRQVIGLNTSTCQELNKRAEFSVLHLHGEEVLFEDALQLLPATAVNWHDSVGKPSLKEAPKSFSGGLFGGLSPDHLLEKKVSLEQQIELRNEVPLILAPECVLWQGTTDKTIEKIFQNYRKEK